MTDWPPDPRLLRKELDYNLLDLPVRTMNALQRNGVKTIGDLVGNNFEQLMEIRGFGITSLVWVYEELSKKGLALKPYMTSRLKKDENGKLVWESGHIVRVHKELRLEDCLWFTLAYEKTFHHPISSTTDHKGA